LLVRLLTKRVGKTSCRPRKLPEQLDLLLSVVGVATALLAVETHPDSCLRGIDGSQLGLQGRKSATSLALFAGQSCEEGLDRLDLLDQLLSP
jgi:hypothetical protein